MTIINVRYDDEARKARGEKNADLLQRLIDVRGKRVLEIGCHLGDTTKVLAEKFGCEVVGIDVKAHPNWSELSTHPKITLIEADISKGHSDLAPESFDRIVSFVVWEHIRHPYSALKQCQSLLKQNGKKFLYANLYRSAIASHMYNIIDVPWHHLTMSPNEIKKLADVSELGWYFWCNKLTYQQYLFYFRQLGFFITYENFVNAYYDKAHYENNEFALDLYPQWDLRTDFFQVVLEFDQSNPKELVADPVYRLKGE